MAQVTRHPRLCLFPSETGSDHLHVIAEEASRVAELCIGQDVGKWYGEIYRIPPKEGGALARQSKDTAM